ncbi:MAG: J domain-containing protein, partial [Gammaproteobacteria bacterium]|nr:J domain-containing protein [Gammaproteobacteria bacterium]
HIRLSGQADSSVPGAAAGDLYLEVAIQPHRFYRVEGADLYYDLPVTPWEAALGASIAVPTPSGTVNLTIPAGSKSGQRLALRGRGIPGKPKGDLFVILTIALPPANTERAKEIYRDMERELTFNPRKHLGVS